MQKKHLTLIKNNIPYKDRIQNRVDAFCADIMQGDGEVEHISQILIAIHDYLLDYEDYKLDNAVLKINEAIYYLDDFIKY